MAARQKDKMEAKWEAMKAAQEDAERRRLESLRHTGHLTTERSATISELRADLERERHRRSTFGAAQEPSGAPTRALSHVNMGGRWVLFEFEERDEPEWRRFDTAAALDDFVRRDPGCEPLVVPEACLTPVPEPSGQCFLGARRGAARRFHFEQHRLRYRCARATNSTRSRC